MKIIPCNVQYIYVMIVIYEMLFISCVYCL